MEVQALACSSWLLYKNWKSWTASQGHSEQEIVHKKRNGDLVKAGQRACALIFFPARDYCCLHFPSKWGYLLPAVVFSWLLLLSSFFSLLLSVRDSVSEYKVMHFFIWLFSKNLSQFPWISNYRQNWQHDLQQTHHAL